MAGVPSGPPHRPLSAAPVAGRECRFLVRARQSAFVRAMPEPGPGAEPPMADSAAGALTGRMHGDYNASQTGAERRQGLKLQPRVLSASWTQIAIQATVAGLPGISPARWYGTSGGGVSGAAKWALPVGSHGVKAHRSVPDSGVMRSPLRLFGVAICFWLGALAEAPCFRLGSRGGA